MADTSAKLIAGNRHQNLPNKLWQHQASKRKKETKQNKTKNGERLSHREKEKLAYFFSRSYSHIELTWWGGWLVTRIFQLYDEPLSGHQFILKIQGKNSKLIEIKTKIKIYISKVRIGKNSSQFAHFNFRPQLKTI